MKKKIGILTTYYASNYGAALQPFALMKTLESLGYDVDMLPYKQESICNAYNPLYYKKFFCYGFAKFVSSVLNLIYTLPREWAFRDYIKKYVTSNRKLTKKVDPNKDVYFIGSDQLWKPFSPNMKFDDVYCGFFDTKKNAKKIAYAVSGEIATLNQDEREYLCRAFDNFDMISVREKIRANQYSSFYKKKDFEIVADPTILADPKIYGSIDTSKVHLAGEFVLFYCIRSGSIDFLEKINTYAQEKKCKLVILSEGFNRDLLRYANGKINVKYYPRAGVDFFLVAVKNANAVFTASFHGNVFSILYHKNLHCLILNDGHDNRAKELLESLEITNRFICIDSPITDTVIDWDLVEMNLSKMRSKAMDFVQRALSLIEC